MPTIGNRAMRRMAFAVCRKAASTTGTLDRLNDTNGRGFMHPTRGARKVNPKRSIAQTINGLIFQGFGPELPTEAKEVLVNG